MSEYVYKKLLRKCRTAVAAGIPILYIKTSSDEPIRKIVFERDEPLVTLISNPGVGSTRFPFYDSGDNVTYKKPEDFTNYSEKLPADLSAISYPHIIVIKMSGKNEEKRREQLNDLENFVSLRCDSNFCNHKILRSSVVICFSDEVYTTPMLRNYTEFIDVEYPDENEITKMIMETAERYGQTDSISDRYLSELCRSLRGFTVEEVGVLLRHIALLELFDDSDETLGIIHDHKKAKTEGGILEYVCDGNEGSGGIGGMDNFKKWLTDQKEPLKRANTYRYELGLLPPKGVLLCGIPGCGKSEAAKYASSVLGIPLLKMDIGSIMDKYQGESERHMREALALAQAVSPCVLWIDEIEKGFSGAKQDNDSSFKRMFAYLLDWMQRNEDPCFIFATANNIGGLPKEFFRSGRFDEIYAVFLPTKDECVGIFKEARKRLNARIFKLNNENEIYSKIIERKLVKADAKPRIIIGSDIFKVVFVAMRNLLSKNERTEAGILPPQSVDDKMWEEALSDAVEKCSLYGDSAENIESIAVSYCRMLRKSFKPTTDAPLFSDSDYDPGRLMSHIKLRRDTDGNTDTAVPDTDSILKKSSTSFASSYDTAVYSLLWEKINEAAPDIEQNEREVLYRM